MGVIDLTMTITSDMNAFPGSPTPQFIQWSDLDKDGYKMELLFMSSHTGTHMDAPSHFYKKGINIDKIPASKLICVASLISSKPKANGVITKQDIVNFESRYGKLVSRQAVVFQTGWSNRIRAHTREYFERNPGISSDAAAHLIMRKINIIGIDSPSIDAGDADLYPAHRYLCKAGIPIVENLTNLSKIPERNFTLVVTPLKLRGATGSPVRAMALWGKDKFPNPKNTQV